MKREVWIIERREGFAARGMVMRWRAWEQFTIGRKPLENFPNVQYRVVRYVRADELPRKPRGKGGGRKGR